MNDIVIINNKSEIEYSGNSIEELIAFLERAYHLDRVIDLESLNFNFGDEYYLMICGKIVFNTRDIQLQEIISELINSQDNLFPSIEKLNILTNWYEKQISLLDFYLTLNLKELQLIFTSVTLLLNNGEELGYLEMNEMDCIDLLDKLEAVKEQKKKSFLILNLFQNKGE